MDVITLAIIGFVAIAGPTILALMLYWRDNPDQRPSWRRAREHARDTDPEHFPGPNWWQPWRSIGGTGSGGGRNNGGPPAEVGRRGPVRDGAVTANTAESAGTSSGRGGG